MQIVVGVSDARTSASAADTLITHALGSCIGVCLYDVHARVGGMLHYQLPDSGGDPQKAAERPLMYADTGFTLLLDRLQHLGASKRRLSVYLAGAAQMLGDQKIFDIGRRNHTAIRKVLWKHGLMITGEHVGDRFPRTMLLNMSDGSVTIRWNEQLLKL